MGGLGLELSVGVPSDATITGSKLASNIGISTTGNIATTGSGTLSQVQLLYLQKVVQYLMKIVQM